MHRDVKRACVLLSAIAIGCGAVADAGAAVPKPWKNCTRVDHTYPHGVGRVGAHDKTSGVPVSNFKRSNQLYQLAMKYNRGLDRDGDKIACKRA